MPSTAYKHPHCILVRRVRSLYVGEIALRERGERERKWRELERERERAENEDGERGVRG